MSDFKDFKNKVVSLGGIWASEDVYFSQTRDGYFASYKPDYPKASHRDKILSDIRNTGAYLRGNYELIQWDRTASKFQSYYFDTLEDIRV